jgi:hypothetical protein
MPLSFVDPLVYHFNLSLVAIKIWYVKSNKMGRLCTDKQLNPIRDRNSFIAPKKYQTKADFGEA